jgi:drug/metabolite transporter (DMT)-like permease
MTLGVVLALLSALVWGSGDFCGGRATVGRDPYQVLAFAAISGVVVLIVSAVVAGEPLHIDRSIAWAIAAGVAGSAGIVCLYKGLSIGSAATVAPLAAVAAAALPVVVSAGIEGFPGPVRLAGFGLALIGIWLVSRAKPEGEASRTGVRLGLLAGVGFGGFLVFIGQAPAGSVFVPLAVARTVMLVTAVMSLAVKQVGTAEAGHNDRTGDMATPASKATAMALLAGALDAGGNMLYLLARQHLRLDVAAVLSSLYPVATVALARVVTREPVTPTQWLGAGVCLAAVMAITA